MRRALGVVRRGAARHLQVVPAADEVRRGGTLEVTVTADSAKAKGRVEVGLVCVETYASFMPQSKLGRSDRMLEDAVAYEQWVPVEGAGPEQTVRLDIPPDAPYSYEGKHLRFRWHVRAREQRERGLDPTRTHDLRVLP